MMLFHGMLFAVSLICGLGSPNDPRGTIVRQELQIRDKKLPAAEAHPLRDIHVFVEVDRVQPAVALGISFVIDVGNAGSEPVELAGVNRHIGLSLWNADGVRVDLPDDERTSRVNYGGRIRKEGLPEPIKVEIEKRRPLAVMKPDLLPPDTKIKSIPDIQDDKIVSVYRFFL